MFGDNPIRKQDLTSPRLKVKEIFYTIQGEGPYAGRPAVFVRLIGCNLRCWFCDTDFESDPQEMSAGEVGVAVRDLAQQYPTAGKYLAVLTGGEPFIQGNILELIAGLIQEGFMIQIETNGTLWIDGLEEYVLNDALSIVVSPKTGKLHPKIQEYAHAFKYIIQNDAVDIEDGLPNLSTQYKDKANKLARPTELNKAIYVQPLDDWRVTAFSVTNDMNKRETAEVAMAHGYRVSFQMHKYLGVK